MRIAIEEPPSQANETNQMEENLKINVLIAADQFSDGELLVSTLRKAGYSVHAESVTDEVHLRERLLQMHWDILFLIPDGQIMPLPRLFATMAEIDQDICFISLGKLHDEDGSPLSPPENCVICMKSDLNKPKARTEFLRLVHRELDNLNTRRKLRKTGAALKELQERYQLLMMSASDAVAYLREGLFLHANYAYLALFGFDTEAQLKQHTFLDLVDEQDVDQVRKFLSESSKKGESRCVFLGITAPNSRTRLSLECANSEFGNEPCIQVVIRHALGNIPQQQKQKSQAHLDLLTNLMNRNAICAEIDQAITTGVYEQIASVIILLKLEEFGDYALLNGKSAANLLLGDAAKLVRAKAPDNAIIGHFGDAEFILLLNNDHSYTQEHFLTDLTASLNGALAPMSARPGKLQFSAGLAIINELTPSASVAVSRARHHLVARANSLQEQPIVQTETYGNAGEMFKRLEQAFEQEDFLLVFQPIVNLKEDGIERYEVRIRLQDHGHLIYPPRFLELANQHGLGERIDRWVCEKSLQILRARDNPALKLTINLTHNSIISTEFLPWLRAQMQSERIIADQISLQISELDVVSAPDQVYRFCEQLKALGFILSITHFGCTLSPVNSSALEDATFVKLDRSLLHEIDNDLIQRDKLNSTVSSLHARGLLVVAPMIEKIDLLPLLWQANINLVQGNCLQEPSADLDFSFVQDEELTLNSFQ